MQDFLKEWGPAIITAVAILLIIAVVNLVPIGDILNDVIDTFAGKVTNAAGSVNVVQTLL